ncbi:hypothetical protein GE09DRAFT_330200 [Coniochaeta sp. 2T2.1]|nr:hypothetical protein GE09DRAFT_330200 [Coniochaeta sp. 2T2.1]
MPLRALALVPCTLVHDGWSNVPMNSSAQSRSPAKADQLVAAKIPYPCSHLFPHMPSEVEDRGQGILSSVDPLQGITPGYHPPPLLSSSWPFWGWGSSLGWHFRARPSGG